MISDRVAKFAQHQVNVTSGMKNNVKRMFDAGNSQALKGSNEWPAG